MGIEVGGDFIRLVELSCGRHGCQVRSCIDLSLSDPSDEVVVQTIKSLLKERGIKTKQVIVALPSSAVTFKEIDVAKNLSSKEAKGFLRFNLAKEMDLPEEEIIFDYQDGELNDISRQLQLVAVKRKHAARQAKLFKKTDLCLKAC